MAHNIFGERFYYRDRSNKPWHNLGICPPEGVEYTAVEAYNKMGPYTISEAPVQSIYDGVSHNIPSLKAIFRDPTADDPQPRLLGTVSNRYVTMQPGQFPEIWDKAFNRLGNVETMGVLQFGAKMFITTKLPDISVGGDDLEPYVMLDVGYDGKGAVRVSIVTVRVVCWNTMQIALRTASEIYALPHSGDIVSHTVDLLKNIYNSYGERMEAVKQFIEMLQSIRAEGNGLADQLFYHVYPVYPEPKRGDYYNSALYEKAIEAWKQQSGVMNRAREGCFRLFDINGSAQPKRTLWDALNSVTEWANWSPAHNERTRARSIMFGDRNYRMARAQRGAELLAEGKQLIDLDMVNTTSLRDAFGAFDD